ncbi:MAG: hypothetical protein ACOX5I_07210 [Gleimia sp.]|jgi:hypothetical protein|nr:hypothetical protein [Acidobacteriota bacterium]
MSEKTAEELKTVEQLDPDTAARLARAPLPTKFTTFKRNFIPYQLARFALFNIRTLDIVRRSM